MQKIGVVTDSTSDLPAALAAEHGIEVIPAVLIIEGNEYADGEGISRGQFYEQLPMLKTSPTTAAPSIGEFSARYESLLSGGCTHVLSIHASEALTSMVATARQAAADFQGRVKVVDSLSLSLGLGFQAVAAAEAASQATGDELKEALAAAESTQRRLHVSAALDTLEYARRSGRVPSLLSKFGGMLHVKPLVEVAAGEIAGAGFVRTTTQANDRLAAFFDLGQVIERLAILHTAAEERARGFLERVMQAHHRSLPRDILLVNVTTVIGTHVGPKALGFAAVTG